MEQPYFLEEIGEDGVARITMTRVEVHNAFNDKLIVELTRALKGLADAEALGELLHTLNFLSKPTLALVQGPAFGGGVGLIAACDIALAADSASFSLSEVKLGLIPAVISPYVIHAIGERAARRYILTGERFDAGEARRVGLVHEVVSADMLEYEGAKMIEALLAAGPEAQREAKDLIFAVAHRPTSTEVIRDTTKRIARVRVTQEGQEGLSAFFEKRPAEWVPEKKD